MKLILLAALSLIVINACSMHVTSTMAEKVTLYKDESAVPGYCKKLGEVTASVCANTTPCPEEVMKKGIREKSFIEYNADAVWLFNTTLSGTEVVGYGIAYRCDKSEDRSRF